VLIPLKTPIYANLLKKIYIKSDRSDSIKTFIKEVIDEVCDFMNNGLRTKFEGNYYFPNFFRKKFRPFYSI
jgi:hypothetical protein